MLELVEMIECNGLKHLNRFDPDADNAADFSHNVKVAAGLQVSFELNP
jgi:hypothetical protein